MSETLQLEVKVIATGDTPKLAVEWSSRWAEFIGSIKPAFRRSEARLAGEAPFGLIPLRIMIPSYVAEAFLILIAVLGYAKIQQFQPTVAPRLPGHEVIYYSGDELPRTEDLGGAETGTAGRAGGDESHHRTQTIKVARGGSLVPKVVDAPNLKLPSAIGAVANLLAIKPNAGPPPAEGLRSTRSAPNLSATLVAPSADVIRDYTRNGIKVDPVIAPAPSISRDRPLTAPNLSATLVAPPADVSSSHTLVAPLLAPIIAPPAANLSRDRAMVAPTLTPSVAAPVQNIRDPFRAAPSLAANVVPPAPAAVSRQLSSAPVQMMDPAVAPPPVSAPEQANARTSKVTLPAPAVVAPPPSTNVSADMRRLASGVPDPGKTVVPPPPAQTSGGSFMSSLVGRIFGPSEVVAPPPNVTARGAAAPSLPANVVPPPATASVETTGSARGNRNSLGASLAANVAPPPSTGFNGGVGHSRAAAPYAGNPTVVPPPPALSGSGGGSGNIGGGTGSVAGALSNTVVPPPPSLSGGTNLSGAGLGRKGPGLAAQLDPGSAATPANNNGSGKDAGMIVSNQPSSTLAVPPSTATGSLAMSPAGKEKPGLGGAGGGSSIARGNGPGSGMTGSAAGAAKSGPGHGSDANALTGISPANGPGGAGSVAAGTPAVRGVDISGGNGQVTLPSFGDDPAASDPNSPGRSKARQHSKTLDVDIVASASSGGAFEPYKNLLHGEKHTMYPETSSSLGAASMEYAEKVQNPGGSFTPPQALRTDLPDGLPRARMVVACTLDAYGNLKNIRVLEAGPAGMTAKILAALSSWKFQPAMRNNQPVEVTAIIGFGINTDDRF